MGDYDYPGDDAHWAKIEASRRKWKRIELLQKAGWVLVQFEGPGIMECPLCVSLVNYKSIDRHIQTHEVEAETSDA